MPSASREIRRKRRVKHNLTLATRAYRQEILDRVKVTTVLLAVLGQQGGEVEITQDTLNTTIKALGTIQYEVVKKNPDSEPFDGQFIVRLVTTTEPTAEANQETSIEAIVPTPEPEQTADEVLEESRRLRAQADGAVPTQAEPVVEAEV